MRTLLALLLAALLAGCSPAAVPSGQPSSPGEAAVPARVGLSYIPNAQFAPFYVAEEDGLLSVDGGTPATLRHHGAQEGLFTALAAGQEDFVLAGGDEMLQARQTGLDLVSVATYYLHYPVVVIVNTDGDIDSLPDLAGKRIGVPGRFGSSWFGLQVALRSAGLTESDVEIIEIGYTQQAALTSDKVDAVVGFSNNDLVQFELAGLAVIGLPISDTPPPLVAASLITTREYLDAHPDTVRGVAEAMVAGINTVAADPERGVAATRRQVPGLSGEALESARATLAATIPIMTTAGRTDGAIDTATWQAMGEFMLASGLLTTAPDITAAIAPGVLQP